MTAGADAAACTCPIANTVDFFCGWLDTTYSAHISVIRTDLLAIQTKVRHSRSSDQSDVGREHIRTAWTNRIWGEKQALRRTFHRWTIRLSPRLLALVAVPARERGGTLRSLQERERGGTLRSLQEREGATRVGSLDGARPIEKKILCLFSLYIRRVSNGRRKC
eukprot:1187959-Prorocentrum_minimum.AAC.6